MSAIDAVPSDQGTILVVTNYTGDCLNFGLASEKANSSGQKCGIIICGDDVSVGKKSGHMVGRRGLASQIMVLKVLGAAASSGASFDECMSLGRAVSEQIVSIAATLDHCSVPGRTEHATLAENEIELGTGPHNEPGYRKISPIPSAEEFIRTIFKYVLDENDPERGYVHFDPGDECVLLVSNFGGMSPLEMGAAVDEMLVQLERDYSIIPIRVYQGPLETSLNALAFSVSVANLTTASKRTSFSVPQMLEFLEVRTNTHWESVAGDQSKRRPRKEQFVAPPKEPAKAVTKDIKVDPQQLQRMVRTACEKVIAAEPNLTKWDTIMGDGDCGMTLHTGASAMIKALDNGLAQSGSCIAVLHELESIVESRMGGTLGGILGILFVSLSAAVQTQARNGEVGIKLWATAVTKALANLQRYTPAKVGDRTVMDVLISFGDTLESSGDFEKAVQVAIEAAEATKKLNPKLGRATYVGGMEGKDLPPDPGAWGAMEAMKGLLAGMAAA